MGNLVLSRRINETIIIGDVSITPIEMHGNQVKILINAPDSVNIVRKEIQDKYSNKWKEREIQHVQND